MKYWYSRNAKLFFRSEIKSYGSSSSYYGYIHNGETFKTITGDTYSYFYPNGSTYQASSTQANFAAGLYSFYDLQAMHMNDGNIFSMHCCNDNDYDDNKYTISNEVTGLTINISKTFPGSTVISLINSTDTPKTLNALLSTHKGNASGSASNYGSPATLLVGGVLFEEEITIAPGGTYTVTLTV